MYAGVGVMAAKYLARNNNVFVKSRILAEITAIEYKHISGRVKDAGIDILRLVTCVWTVPCVNRTLISVELKAAWKICDEGAWICKHWLSWTGLR